MVLINLEMLFAERVDDFGLVSPQGLLGCFEVGCLMGLGLGGDIFSER